jgi:hypothetical protein
VSRWYRAYEGTVTDAKLAEAALDAEVSRSVAIAAWHCLLESAACKNNCGSYETNAKRVALILCEPVERVQSLFAAFDEIGLTTDGAITCWKKRQHESDSSAERTRKWRDKKRQETAECDGGDDNVTSRDAPKTETETETEVLSSNEDSPSGDEPAFRIEHVFEGYQKLAGDLGLTVPRDLTPERRALLRSRRAQYPIDDFFTVFTRCRGSPFLRGDKGRTPLAFDWLFKKANFQKVLEGNYDR